MPGERLAALPGYGVFRCADGWIALSGITEQHFWTTTCDGLGLDDVRDLPLLDQMERSEELSGRIADTCAGLRTRRRTRGDRRHRHAVAPVYDRTEMLADEHLRAHGTVLDGPDGRPALAHPVRYVDHPAHRSRPHHRRHRTAGGSRGGLGIERIPRGPGVVPVTGGNGGMRARHRAPAAGSRRRCSGVGHEPGEERGHAPGARRASGSAWLVQRCDVGDEGQVIDAVRPVRARARQGRLPVRQRGAWARSSPFTDMTLEEWRFVMRVNLDRRVPHVPRGHPPHGRPR